MYEYICDSLLNPTLLVRLESHHAEKGKQNAGHHHSLFNQEYQRDKYFHMLNDTEGACGVPLELITRVSNVV